MVNLLLEDVVEDFGEAVTGLAYLPLGEQAKLVAILQAVDYSALLVVVNRS